jgi:hypothetical protein
MPVDSRYYTPSVATYWVRLLALIAPCPCDYLAEDTFCMRDVQRPGGPAATQLLQLFATVGHQASSLQAVFDLQLQEHTSEDLLLSLFQFLGTKIRVSCLCVSCFRVNARQGLTRS